METAYAQTYAGWIEALTIFAKYSPTEIYVIHPAHDVVYAGADILPDEADSKRLRELHWYWDNLQDCWYHYT